MSSDNMQSKSKRGSLPQDVPLSSSSITQIQLIGNLRKETLLRDRYHHEKKINELKVQQMEEEMILLKKQMKVMIDKCKTQIQSMMQENSHLKRQNHDLLLNYQHQQQKGQLEKNKAQKIPSPNSGLPHKTKSRIITVPEAMEEAAVIRSLSPTKQQKLHDYLQELLIASSLHNFSSQQKLTLQELDQTTPALAQINNTEDQISASFNETLRAKDLSSTGYEDKNSQENEFYHSTGSDGCFGKKDTPGASPLLSSSIRSVDNSNINLQMNNSMTPASSIQTPSSAITDSSGRELYISSSTTPGKAASSSDNISPFIVPEAVFSTLQNHDVSIGTIGTTSSTSYSTSPVKRMIDFQNESLQSIEMKTEEDSTQGKSSHDRLLAQKEESEESALDLKVKSMIQKIEEKVTKSNTSTPKTRSALKERNSLQEHQRSSSRSKSTTPKDSKQSLTKSKKDSIFFPDSIPAGTSSLKEDENSHAISKRLFEVENNDPPREMSATVSVNRVQIPGTPVAVKTSTEDRGITTSPLNELSEAFIRTKKLEKEESERQVTYYSSELEAMKQKYSQAIITLTRSSTQQKEHNAHLQEQNRQLLSTIEEKYQILQEYELSLHAKDEENKELNERLEQLEQITQRIYQDKKQSEIKQQELTVENNQLLQENERYQQQLAVLAESSHQQAENLLSTIEQQKSQLTYLQDELTITQTKYSQLVQSIHDSAQPSTRIEGDDVQVSQATSSESYEEGLVSPLAVLVEESEEEEGEGEDHDLKNEEESGKISNPTEVAFVGTQTEPEEEPKPMLILPPLPVETSTIAIMTEVKEMSEIETNTDSSVTLIASFKEKEELEIEINNLHEKVTSLKNKFKHHSQKLKEKINLLEQEKNHLEKEKDIAERTQLTQERLLMNYEEDFFSTKNLKDITPLSDHTEEGAPSEPKEEEDRAVDEASVTAYSQLVDEEGPITASPAPSEDTFNSTFFNSASVEIGYDSNHLSDNSPKSPCITLTPEKMITEEQNSLLLYQEKIESLQSEVIRLEKQMKQRSSKAIQKMKSLFEEISNKSRQLESQKHLTTELETIINATRYENSSLKKEINKLTTEIQKLHNDYYEQMKLLQLDNEKKTSDMNKLVVILEKERLQMKQVQNSLEILGKKKEKLLLLSSSAASSASNSPSVCNSTMNSRASSPTHHIHLMNPTTSSPPNTSNGVFETISEENETERDMTEENHVRVINTNNTTHQTSSTITHTTVIHSEHHYEQKREYITVLAPKTPTADRIIPEQREDIVPSVEKTVVVSHEGLEHDHQQLVTVNQQFQEEFQNIQQNLQQKLKLLAEENHHIIDYIQRRATEHNHHITDDIENTNNTKTSSTDSNGDGSEEYEVVEGSYRTCIQDYTNQINSISLTLFERIKLLYKENEAKSDEIEELKKQQTRSHEKIHSLEDTVERLEAKIALLSAGSLKPAPNEEENDNNDSSHQELQFLYYN